MLAETRSALLCLVLSLTVLPAYVLLFSRLRLVVVVLPGQAGPVPPAAGVFEGALANTTRADACIRACGLGSSCDQSGASGIVRSCLSCPTGQLPVGARCSSVPQFCVTFPWCASAEARLAQSVHDALVLAAVGLFNGTKDVQFPTGQAGVLALQASRGWPSISAQLGADAGPQALSLLADLAAGNGTSGDPSRWFDDQHGWWAASLPLYRMDLPDAFAPYVTHMKRRICARTWAAADSKIGATCAPPA